MDISASRARSSVAVNCAPAAVGGQWCDHVNGQQPEPATQLLVVLERVLRIDVAGLGETAVRGQVIVASVVLLVGHVLAGAQVADHRGSDEAVAVVEHGLGQVPGHDEIRDAVDVAVDGGGPVHREAPCAALAGVCPSTTSGTAVRTAASHVARLAVFLGTVPLCSGPPKFGEPDHEAGASTSVSVVSAVKAWSVETVRPPAVPVAATGPP
jgi:hypothetical protein